MGKDKDYFNRIIILLSLISIVFAAKLICLPKTLEESDLAEGNLKSIDTLRKIIAIDVKIDFSKLDIPKSEFVIDDGLFNEINDYLIASEDSSHYIKIWYKYNNVKNKVGTSHWFEYYQITIDGKTIKEFDSFIIQVPTIIVLAILCILLIIFFCRGKDKFQY